MLWHVVQATRHQLERWVPSGTWADFTTAVVGFGQLVQATAMCISCMCTACALRVHCVCTACALHVHYYTLSGILMQRGAAWRTEFAECVERTFGVDSTQVCAWYSHTIGIACKAVCECV
jgi:hypothetical protein